MCVIGLTIQIYIHGWVSTWKDRRTEGWDGGRAAGWIIGWLPTLRRRNGPALSNVFIALYV